MTSVFSFPSDQTVILPAVVECTPPPLNPLPRIAKMQAIVYKSFILFYFSRTLDLGSLFNFLCTWQLDVSLFENKFFSHFIISFSLISFSFPQWHSSSVRRKQLS